MVGAKNVDPVAAPPPVAGRIEQLGDGTNSLTVALRSAIIDGVYAPGQRLVEADICAKYAASRAAVRVALQQLMGDGLVELLKHKGARVREISLDEAIEVTEVRMLVEGLAARKAAERINDDQAQLLADTGRRMRTAVEQLEMLDYSELNAQLHSAIRTIAAHQTATDTIERLRAQVVRYQFRLSLQQGRPSVSLPQHELIIKSIVARRPVEAEQAMHAHLSSVIDVLRSRRQDC